MGENRQITVDGKPKGDRWECHVTITEGSSRTQHNVTVENSYRDELVGSKVPAAELVRKSFEFLLEREPKESILRSFDLKVIRRYYPEYEREIRSIFPKNQ